MKDWILSHKKQMSVGLVLFAVLAAALGFAFSQKTGLTAPQAEDTMSLTEQNPEIDVWGEVKYLRMEDISIDFPSIVTKVEVQEGDRVKKGQLLVTLDISEYNANLEKTRQQLAVNEAGLPAASEDVSALQADIIQTKDQIARKAEEYSNETSEDIIQLKDSLKLAKAQLESANTDFQSYQELYDIEAVSEAVLNQYKDILDQRRNAVDSLESNLNKTKAALKDELSQLNVSLKSKQAQLSQAQAGNTANVAKQEGGISAAQADMGIIEAKTKKTYIKDNQIVSDIENGIIQNIAVSEAAYLGVQGMPTKVLQIIDADSIVISAEVDEEFIGYVSEGKTVRIVPASSPGVSLTGTVIQIPNIAVEKNGRRIVRVVIKPDDPEYLLKPGYTADVYIER